MKALFFITKRTFVNKLKKALHKPITWLYLVFGGIYIFIVLAAIGGIFTKMRLNSPLGITALATLVVIYIYGTDFVAHAKRKGILFKQSHAHLVFTAPINPKVILLYASAKNFLMTFIISVFLCLSGVTVFGLSALQGFLLFLLSSVLALIFEGSQIIFFYANERFSEKQIKIISKAIYGILLIFAGFLIWYFRGNGFSVDSVKELVTYPALRIIPILGWNLAAYHLILFGPSLLNYIGTVLYLLCVGGLLFVAVKQKCQGEYFEDAAKFADDYADFRNRNKKGDTTLSIGKRKKFKAVNSTYRASGSAAIFYRQLLEYKKERFFIFGKMTLISIGISLVVIKGIGKPDSFPGEFFLLGVAAYMVFLTSGYLGKWEKELKNPYLFLIPDAIWKKMWYATAMEHIRAAVDGAFLLFPIGIAWQVEIWKIIIIWLIYIVLQANKLYLRVFADSLLGETLGTTGKSILRSLIQSGIIGVGIFAAFMAYILAGGAAVYLVGLIYVSLVTVIVALLAVGRFGQMEQAE